MKKIFTAEERKAWDDVLFWAKRQKRGSASGMAGTLRRSESQKGRIDGGKAQQTGGAVSSPHSNQDSLSEWKGCFCYP